MIPGVLREFAGLEKDVVLIGVASRIEIWDKEKLNQSQIDEDDMESIAEQMEELGLGI